MVHADGEPDEQDRGGDRLVDGRRLAEQRRRAANPGLRIEQIGDASSARALGEVFEKDFKKAETLSLPVTLLILIVAFGSLVAAGLALLLALSAVFATIGLVSLFSQASPVDESITSVILLIGLAVGVDHVLFYLRREREERAAGRSAEAALEAASATSGRAVLISGFTVMVAMAGMYFTGSSTFSSFATGTIMVVAVAMIGSITVLPALLSKLGDRVETGRIRPRRDAMDYYVFIISRSREAFDRGMTTEQAVAHGIKSTTGVVTSAAIVMVAVFSIFATLTALETR